MPVFTVTDPDGNVYKLNGPEGATQADAIQQAQLLIAAGQLKPIPKPKEGFIADIEKGAKSAYQGAKTGISALFGDKNEAARRGLEEQRRLEEEYKQQVDLGKIKEAYQSPEGGLLSAAGETARQIPHAIVEGLPMMGQMAAGARLGAMAGSPFGPLGVGIGAGVGAIGSIVPQMAGQGLVRQAAEQQATGAPVDVSVGKAYTAAVPQAALMEITRFMPIGKSAVAKVLGVSDETLAKRSAAEIEALANESFAKAAARGTLEALAVNIPGSAGMSMLDRWQAGLPLTSDDALLEYGESIATGSMIAPMGVIGGLGKRSTARDQVMAKEVQKGIEAQELKAQEQQAEMQRQQTPEYALEAQRQYMEAEKAFRDLKAQHVKPSKDSPTYAADMVDYKARGAQLNELAKRRNELAEAFKKVEQYLPKEKPVQPAAGATVPGAEALQPEFSKKYVKDEQGTIPMPEQPKGAPLDLFGKKMPVETTTKMPEEPMTPLEAAEQIRKIDAALQNLGETVADSPQHSLDLARQANAMRKARAELEPLAAKVEEQPTAVTQEQLTDTYAQWQAANKQHGGSSDQAVKLAKKLQKLQEAYKTRGAQGEFEMQPFTGKSEGAQEFALRRSKPGIEAGAEGEEADYLARNAAQEEAARAEAERNRKVVPEEQALQRIQGRNEGVNPQWDMFGERENLPTAPSPATGQMVQKLTGEDVTHTAELDRGERQVQRGGKAPFNLYPRREGTAEPLTAEGIRDRIFDLQKRDDLSPEARAFLERASRAVTDKPDVLSLFDEQLRKIESGEEGTAAYREEGVGRREVTEERNIRAGRAATAAPTAATQAETRESMGSDAAKRLAAARREKFDEGIEQGLSRAEAARRANMVKQPEADEIYERRNRVVEKQTVGDTAGKDTLRGPSAKEVPAKPMRVADELEQHLRLQEGARTDDTKQGDLFADQVFGANPAANRIVRSTWQSLQRFLGSKKFAELRATHKEIKKVMADAKRQATAAKEVEELRKRLEDQLAALDAYREAEGTLKAAGVRADMQQNYEVLLREYNEKRESMTKAAVDKMQLDSALESAKARVEDLMGAEDQGWPGRADLIRKQFQEAVEQLKAVKTEHDDLLNNIKNLDQHLKVLKAKLELEFLREDAPFGADVEKTRAQLTAAEQRLKVENELMAKQKAEQDAAAGAARRKAQAVEAQQKSMADEANDTLYKEWQKAQDELGNLPKTVVRMLSEHERRQRLPGQDTKNVTADEAARDQFAREQEARRNIGIELSEADRARIDLYQRQMEEWPLAKLEMEQGLLSKKMAETTASVNKAKERTRNAMNKEREQSGLPAVIDLPVTTFRGLGAAIKMLAEYKTKMKALDRAIAQRQITEEPRKKERAVKPTQVESDKIGMAQERLNSIADAKKKIKDLQAILDAADTTDKERKTFSADLVKEQERLAGLLKEKGVFEAKSKVRDLEKRAADGEEGLDGQIAEARRLLNELENAGDAPAIGRGQPAMRPVAGAPGKLRTGSKKSKSEAGVSRSPITEQRKTAVESVKKIIEQANAQSALRSAATEPTTAKGKRAKSALDAAVAAAKLKGAEKRFAELTLQQLEKHQVEFELERQREKPDPMRLRRLRNAVEGYEHDLISVLSEGLPQGVPEPVATGRKASVKKGLTAEDVALRADEEPPSLMRGIEGPSNDFTPTQRNLLESNDLEGALHDIASDPRANDLDKAVARRLADILDATDVKLVDKVTDEAGNEAFGSATSKEILISKDGGLSHEVLLHEGTHAGVERVIQLFETAPEKLSELQRTAVKELKALHAAIKNDPSVTSKNAKSSVSEFAAEALSNKVLQEQLRNKKWKLSDAWKGFKSIILRMLGIKDPENMLGATLQSVDALMTPSSKRGLGTETPVTKRLSQKDIAALHTGSNSMKQFADQFGNLIKQADRTPADVERIGKEMLHDMYWKPSEYVAYVEDSKALPYNTRMPDGSEYDPSNLQHFLTADFEVKANHYTKNNDASRSAEMRNVNNARKKDFRKLLQALEDGPFTTVEQALVAKAAGKWAILSDANGRLKTAEIAGNNRHMISVVGPEDINNIVAELRAGKPLKQAFLDGKQAAADRAAKENAENKLTGWKRFAKSSKQEDAVALNKGAAGTSWCTGAAVGTAAAQLERGDFYIYYKNGKPEVAVRMDKYGVGEIRGNTPKQGLTNEQLAIATEFLNKKKLPGGEAYLEEIERKETLAALARGESIAPEKFVMMEIPFTVSGGDLLESRVAHLLDFGHTEGYFSMDDDSGAQHASAVSAMLMKEAKAQAKKGVYAMPIMVSYGKGTGTIDGRDIVVAPQDIRMASNIMLHHYDPERYGPANTAFDNLTHVRRLAIYGGNNVAVPNAQHVKHVTYAKNTTGEYESSITLPSGARIDEVTPGWETVGDSKQVAKFTINGVTDIGTLSMRNQYETDSVGNFYAPDLEYAVIKDPAGEITSSKVRDLIMEHVQRDGMDEGRYPEADLEIYSHVASMLGDEFGDRHLQAAERAAATREAELRADLAEDLEPMHPMDVQQDIVDAGMDAILDSIYKEYGMADTNARLNKLFAFGGVDKLPESFGMLDAPNYKGGNRPVPEVTAEQERPRYAMKPAYADKALEEAGSIADKFVAKHQTWTEKVRANASGLAFETQLVDRFAPLERLSKLMEPLKGTQMMSYLRMYDQRMHFVSQSVANGVVQKVEKTRPDGRKEYVLESVKGANLKDIAQILSKSGAGNADAANRLFTLYLAANRAKRHGLSSLNLDGTITQADLDKAVAAIKAKPGLEANFKLAQDKYNEYNRNLIGLLESTGAITKELADTLRKHDDYIPFYREDNGVAKLFIGGEHPINIGSIAEQPYLHELVGGNKPILDFLTSSVQNTNILTDMALRNLATKNAVYELVNMDLAKISNSKSLAGPNVVRFRDKGAEKSAIIDTDRVGIPAELLVKGMEGIPTQLPGVMRLMAAPARLLRKAVTISPVYAAKQVFRDSLAAPIVSGADFTPVMGALRQIGSANKHVLDNRGVTGGQQFTGAPEDLSLILRQITSGKGNLSELLSKAEAMGMKADALTRRAQYDAYRKQGLSEMEATLMSLESMNFSKRGASPSVHMVNSLLPFVNAQIQSLNVLYKAATGKMPMNDRLKIQEKLLTRGLMLAGVSMAYALAMQDDEAYKNATPDQRANSWFVRIPGVDEPIRVPVPFEIGYIFKALPEAILNMVNGKHGSEDAQEALKFIAKQMIPGASSWGLPQALKPMVEVGLNRSTFTGRDIVNAHEQKLLPEYQYRDYTSEIAKIFGGATGISPIKIDALVNGYTGAMGLAFMQAAGMGFANAPSNAPEKNMSDLPIIGGAFQKNDAGQIVNDMYKHMQRAEQVKATFDDLVAKGKKAEAQALLQNPENKIDYAMAPVAQQYLAQMAKFRKMQNDVKATPNLTPAEKRERLMEIQKAMTEYAKKAREGADKAKDRVALAQ